jgi:hypothetical protein
MDAGLRLEVRDRASGRCEYCHILAQHDRLPFQVDHVISLKHGGSTVLENLAWSCFDCNIYKGPNIAGVDPTATAVTRLFHPRTDNWIEHFRYDGPLLVGNTPIGGVTLNVLRINLPTRVEHRRMLLAGGLW